MSVEMELDMSVAFITNGESVTCVARNFRDELEEITLSKDDVRRLALAMGLLAHENEERES